MREILPVWLEALIPVGVALAVSFLIIAFVRFGLFLLYPEPW